MLSVEEVLAMLKAKARVNQLEGMARYGMKTEKRLGVSIPDLRGMATKLGKNHSLALALWRTRVADAQILAALIDEPEKVTEEQMEDWVRGFDYWDVCDQVCLNLFCKTPLAWKKIIDWSMRDGEFVKRAAFAIIACLAWKDKKATDEDFVGLFSVIKCGAVDDRNFVKKAVNWALRNIGKRNMNLNRSAIALAKEVQLFDSKAAKWIASDTLRELESAAVQRRLSKATG